MSETEFFSLSFQSFIGYEDHPLVILFVSADLQSGIFGMVLTRLQRTTMGYHFRGRELCWTGILHYLVEI